ncbi:MAG: PepSY domain-containing protein [Acidobacteriota bacterium]
MKIENIVRVLVIVGAAALPVPSSAKMACSIHPPKGASTADLKALAKVTEETAKTVALATLKVGAAVTEAELESEHGCLIYSFDIQLPGVSGIEELAVDAGSGKVLAHEHESARHEAAEKAKENAEKKPPVRRG